MDRVELRGTIGVWMVLGSEEMEWCLEDEVSINWIGVV